MTPSARKRTLRWVLPVLGAALVAPMPHPALAKSSAAAPTAAPLQREISKRSGDDLKAFYAARNFTPLWLELSGQPSPAARLLLEQLQTADMDGLDPKALKADKLAKLLDKAERGGASNDAQAEVELSRAFVAYVRAMRAGEREEMIYETSALRPVVPTARAVLDSASRVPLESYVAQMGWMHPLYAPLRRSLADPQFSELQRRQIWTNLNRVRAIPAMTSGRHVLVDAAGATLWMYENGQVVDSMKVVVGKPDLQTPMMAGFIRYAIVNPYWNVPEDLAQTNIAANVLDRGVKYLKAGGYQVLSDWSDNPKVLDPKKIDWKAVHEGRTKVRVRQLPGGSNFMGDVKFMFPNNLGIYLHDTPDKHLLERDERQLSSGCVRLEDAARLGKWLMGKPLPAKVKNPEQKLSLPEPVPVYITYLTAAPVDGGQIAFHSDPYARDGFQLAAASDSEGARADRP